MTIQDLYVTRDLLKELKENKELFDISTIDKDILAVAIRIISKAITCYEIENVSYEMEK